MAEDKKRMTGDKDGNGLINIDEWASMTLQEKSDSMRESAEKKAMKKDAKKLSSGGIIVDRQYLKGK